MIHSSVRRSLTAVFIAALAASPGWSADSSSRPRSESGKSATPAQRQPARSTGARGMLPDPVLLDGSTHPAEKKSEYGMIGDFELPGDENARNGRVGGPQAQQQHQQGQQNGAGGMALPQMGGGGQQAQQQQQGGGGEQGQQSQGGGPANPNAAGQQVAGGGDPNAKAEGVQVAQLGGEGQQGGTGPGEKPPPVAIGDRAMQIQTPPGAAAAVGAQQQQIQGNTQHHEKGTGTGGKAPTGVQGNNRVERGRTIPAGL